MYPYLHTKYYLIDAKGKRVLQIDFDNRVSADNYRRDNNLPAFNWIADGGIVKRMIGEGKIEEPSPVESGGSLAPYVDNPKWEACMKEMAQWYVKHRRKITMEEFIPIALRHLPNMEDVDAFSGYLESDEGAAEFGKLMRLYGVKSALEKPKLGPKFKLGGVYLTRGVAARVEESIGFASFVNLSVKRHAVGDWGDLEEEDKRANEEALQHGNRLFSAYEMTGVHPRIWIITEADRSATTILFPDEY